MMFCMFGSKSVRSLRPEEVRELVQKGEATLVDVREPHEWASGHIPGALHAPLSQFAAVASTLPVHKPVILYCLSGARSQRALQLCKQLGLPFDTHMGGGIAAWRAGELPIEK